MPKHLLLAAAVAVLVACQAKDKSDQQLKGGAIVPPWDSARFVPKRLDHFAFAGPESLFAVFRDIAAIDSAAGGSTVAGGSNAAGGPAATDKPSGGPADSANSANSGKA